jgi:hypothetical protein
LPSTQSVEAFLGRWDLTLKAPDREYPSWLELRQEGSQLKAQMVSRWGNARPLPKVDCPARTGEWQSFDITLVGRWITVVQNSQTIIDNQEIPGITGGALDSHEELPGPIYLQGSEKGHVAYRSIVITPAQK